jgi:hypothetical protein
VAILQQIIDRRLSGKNKSIGNRERFLRRYKGQIQEAVRRAVSGRNIRELEQGEDVTLPRHDVSEPVFGHARGGDREYVHPGNQEYLKGDRIKRPEGGGGGGSGSGEASDSGEGEDDFVFRLTREEFMRVFFDDLALPHLIRTQIADVPEWKSHRAGFTSDGSPNNLHVVRSMRGALARRIALGGEPRKELKRLELHLEAPEAAPAGRAGAHPERDPRDRGAHRGAAPHHAARALHRPDRPALPQPREDAGAQRQGRDVLPDGRVGLHGRGAQGHGQALLHAAVHVPHAALRKDRPRVPAPSHPGAGGDGGRVLPRHRDGRHGGVERAGADGRDHQGALPERRMERVRRAGQRRRQLAPGQRALPRAAGQRHPADGALLRLRAGGRDRAEPVAGVRAARRRAAQLRDAQGIRRAGHLSGFRDLFKKEGVTS